MKALVTGVSGFVGSHMAEYLLDRGVEVVGTIRNRSRKEHIRHIESKIHLAECELRDPFSVETLLMQERPDLIFHLAAQSFVPTSWNSPVDTITNNVAGQLNIFEAVRRHDLTARSSSLAPVKNTAMSSLTRRRLPRTIRFGRSVRTL